jgi:Fur family ferric uptake transcriptional regulator
MREEASGNWSEHAWQVLARGGHHAGRARSAVVELLDAQTCALSALEIEDELRKGERRVGRASIYRILDQLERLHLVQRVQLGHETARYEPIRTGAGHHHHIVCDTCGVVTPFSDEQLEDAIASLSNRLPMRVAEHEIVLHGACQACEG